MNGEEQYPEESRSLESLREVRLLALLWDMVGDEGKVKTAAALGVNYRTVDRAVESGRLTARMSDALERRLLLGGGSAAARQRERVETLEQRVEALEALGLAGEEGLEAIAGEVKALGEEHAQGMRRIERRLTQSEAGRVATGAAAVEKPAVKSAWRPYRDVATLEPEPGEEQVYGEARPLIVEWREARAEFTKAGDRLSRATAEGRMLELEIAIIEGHELTLPPATYPWDRFGRRDEVWRRTRDLERVRVERNRALLRRWLRRALTLGLWWD